MHTQRWLWLWLTGWMYPRFGEGSQTSPKRSLCCEVNHKVVTCFCILDLGTAYKVQPTTVHNSGTPRKPLWKVWSSVPGVFPRVVHVDSHGGDQLYGNAFAPCLGHVLHVASASPHLRQEVTFLNEVANQPAMKCWEGKRG